MQPMQLHMLTPAAVLVLWSLIMLLWMVLIRFAAFGSAGIDLSKAPPGGRGQDLDAVLPAKTMWKAHNYNHLMEQPTIFYPIVVILALIGPTLGDIRLAWAYVGLRVAHSLWQALVNTIPVRVTLFASSTIVLLALAARALMACLIPA